MTVADRQHRTRGIGLVAGLMVMVLGWMSWSAWHRPVRLTDRGAALDASQRRHWPDMRVNLNAAAAAELALLPAVGPQLAQRTVDERDKNGPFTAIDDLRRVKGIGQSVIERLEPYAVVPETRPDSGESGPG